MGTVVATFAALYFLPPIIESPELTLAFLALWICAWIGACLTISLLDRTPKAYFIYHLQRANWKELIQLTLFFVVIDKRSESYLNDINQD